MEQIGNIQNISEILQLLAPGFLATFLFYSLTSFPKKSEFEMVIMAVIYTVAVNLLTNIVKETLFLLPLDFGFWDNTTQNIWTFIIAFLLGIFIAWIYKKKYFNIFLQKFFGVSIYPSAWYSAFSNLSTEESYITLYFIDNSPPVMGIPLEWSNDYKEGYFLLERVIYLIEDGNGYTQKPFPPNYRLLVNVKDVKSVVFLREKKEDTDESN